MTVVWNGKVTGIIAKVADALDHYRAEHPGISRNRLLNSSANSLIVQILEHGEMGDDADLTEAIKETTLVLAALQRARTRRQS